MKQAFAVARENSRKAAKTSAIQYNKRTAPIKFKLGDRVYLKEEALKAGRSKKFRMNYSGPYRIIDRLRETTFKIKPIYGGKSKVTHVNRLKLAKGLEDLTCDFRDNLVQNPNRNNDSQTEDELDNDTTSLKDPHDNTEENQTDEPSVELRTETDPIPTGTQLLPPPAHNYHLRKKSDEEKPSSEIRENENVENVDEKGLIEGTVDLNKESQRSDLKPLESSKTFAPTKPLNTDYSDTINLRRSKRLIEKSLNQPKK